MCEDHGLVAVEVINDVIVDRNVYLRNGGYYLAINDYIDLALRGDVYTKGSWGLPGGQVGAYLGSISFVCHNNDKRKAPAVVADA